LFARATSLCRVPIALFAPAAGVPAAASVFRAVSSPADEARAEAKLAADMASPPWGCS